MKNKTEVILTETSWEAGQVITIDSREVAVMIGKNHNQVLEMIQGRGKNVGIIPVLLSGNFTLSNYFIESSYKDASGKANKCYLVTKMGCELIGNKQQGAKGIEFSAKYVERFNQMEKELSMSKYNLPSNFKEALLLLVEAEEEKERLIASNNEKKAIIQIQAPKVELYNDFINTDNLYTVNDIAKTLAIKDLGRNNLYKWLKWNKILIDTNEAYQRFVNSGYIIHRNVPFSVPVYEWKDGNKKQKGYEKRVEMKIYFTAKGVAWLYKKLVVNEYKINKTVEVVIEELNSLQENKNN